MAGPIHIVIIEEDQLISTWLADLLHTADYRVSVIADASIAVSSARSGQVDIILTELATTDVDGFELLRDFKSRHETEYIPIMVMTSSNHEDDFRLAFEAGADDFVRKPIAPHELLGRINALLRHKQDKDQLRAKRRDTAMLLELTQILTSTRNIDENMFTVVRSVANLTNFERVSMILFGQGEDPVDAFVIAASDNPSMKRHRIELTTYPELLEVRRRSRPLVIPDIDHSDLLHQVRDTLHQKNVRSCVVVPILLDDEVQGALLLRTSSEQEHWPANIMEFCVLVANATSIALRNARTYDDLRTRAAFAEVRKREAEKKAEIFERFGDYFHFSTIGMMVTDHDGAVAFANEEAGRIVEATPSAMVGQNLGVFFGDNREVVHSMISDAAQSNDVFTREITLMAPRSAVTRTVIVRLRHLEQHMGTFIVSLTDVTEERKLGEELQRTKDFLESLIDSSPDAIVAADRNGDMVLFNRGAERLFGYKAEEVIRPDKDRPATGVSRRRITRLYARPDQAFLIMKALKDAREAGEETVSFPRIEIRGRNGEEIPVAMNASFIYEGDVEVGTMGIFRDLREKEEVERKLNAVEAELAQRERIAAMAELAGAAAHELNQPLTAVMGYAELMLKRLPPEDRNRRAAEAIFREAERLADIVKKIGRITKYETTSYVGQTRILDLDKAAQSDETPPSAGGK
ncbi:MAG: Regulator of RpoS [Myxococcota bacterium]|nr:Regulator of RpoS [Myxococcota bacterium]